MCVWLDARMSPENVAAACRVPDSDRSMCGCCFEVLCFSSTWPWQPTDVKAMARTKFFDGDILRDPSCGKLNLDLLIQCSPAKASCGQVERRSWQDLNDVRFLEMNVGS